MEAIYASKIYKLSRRKDRIASALNDPINMELVQQLSSYLDESVKHQVESPSKSIEPAPTTDTDVKSSPFDSNATSSRSQSSRSQSSGDSVTTAPDSTPVDMDSESSDTLTTEQSKDTDDSISPELNAFHDPKKHEAVSDTAEETSDVSVEESTGVTAATVLYQPSVSASCCDKIKVDVAAIKGTLNIRNDTQGVSRIFVKDTELWIYYQDKINLNSVMEPVIEVLNSTGFTNLEFNRLARSENAIVFEISCTYDDIQPLVKEV